MPNPLFIYGTLHPDRAPAAIAATARLLVPLGRATIQGQLYDLSEYPGVILTSNTSAGPEHGGIVSGELFSIPEHLNDQGAEAILSRLDAYEDFRPADPDGSLFLRQLTRAKRDDGIEIVCWIYTYNRPII